MNQAASSSQGPTQSVAPFPSPPEYFQNYTNEMIRANQAPKPPKVPTRFNVFNEEYNLEGPMIASLAELEIPQYYNSKESWKTEFKKLNFSVVANFLDLLEILIKNPQHSDRKEKIETLRTLFINMHHIINESRPIQARETLVEMMRKQNKELQGFIDKVKIFNASIQRNIAKLNEATRNADLDLSCPPAPSAYMEPPEHKVMTYNIAQNKRMTNNSIGDHEFKCRHQTLSKHLQLMRLAEADEEKYTEEFKDSDLVDDDHFNGDLAEHEKESESEEENAEFIQEEDEPESSGEEEVESQVIDVGVEYMDDDEDDDDEDSDDMAGIGDDMEAVTMQSSDEEPSSPEDNDNGVEPPAELLDGEETRPPSNEPQNADSEINLLQNQEYPTTPEIQPDDEERNSRSDSE